jgi:hypothetical protein
MSPTATLADLERRKDEASLRVYKAFEAKTQMLKHMEVIDREIADANEKLARYTMEYLEAKLSPGGRQ